MWIAAEARYKTSRPTRGQCVIFNHEKFKQPDLSIKRIQDAEQIKTTFENFYFYVKICNDLTCESIKTELQDRKNPWSFASILEHGLILMMKLVTLLQNDDACLGKIVTSQLWGISRIQQSIINRSYSHFGKPIATKAKDSVHEEFEDVSLYVNVILASASITCMKDRVDHNTNCICMFMLTLGAKFGKLMARDGDYKFDTIWEPFTADNFRKFAGKPKLFFYDASIGRKKDTGVRGGGTPDTLEETTPITIPTHADYLLCYSSSKGFVSERSIGKGSRFTQTLCKVLDKYANRQDLSSMLIYTAGKVGELGEQEKQTPVFMCSLTKILKFRHNNYPVPTQKKQVPGWWCSLL